MTTTLALEGTVDRATAPPATVLLIGPLPPPSAGMANQTRQLANLLAAEGCHVRVVQTNAAYRPAWVGRVRGLRALFRLAPYLLRLWRETREVAVVHVMANSGWAWHLFVAPAVWIAALRGVPTMINYRGGEAATFFERQFALVRPTLARARLVVVPSGFLRDVFARHGVDATIVPNIVDLERFRPAAARPRTLHVLIARNLEAIYGIDTALRAFALALRRVPDAQMTIAGTGDARQSLERLAAELGVTERVRFTGRLDNAELPALYAQASVALNPSRVDNMPISLLEAMASGVPIVSTRVGGVPYLVEDGRTALLLPPDEPAPMADALVKLAQDAELADRLAAQGLRTAEQYAWPRVRERLFLAYAASRGAKGAD
jgi:glycosyltransferase involved in cell wall biosynthesis